MHKKVICPTLIFLISIFFFGCATSSTKESKSKLSEQETKKVVPIQNNKTSSKVPFTIMTFNIRVGAGITNLKTHPYKLEGSSDNLDFIAKAIKSVDPDVIGLQEVRGKDQAQKLAESLNMNYIYRRHGSHPAAKWWGIAILSKHRIIDAENYGIIGRGSNRKFERILLKCTIEIKGRKITVFNTHVSHLSDQKTQINNILKRIKDSQNPVIVMGDSNIVPESPTIKPLKVNLIDACEKVISENADFIKINGTLHPDLVRERGAEAKNFWKTSYEDHFRIDYIFCEPKSIRVVDVGLTDKEYWDASDHIGYFARLELI